MPPPHLPGWTRRDRSATTRLLRSTLLRGGSATPTANGFLLISFIPHEDQLNHTAIASIKLPRGPVSTSSDSSSSIVVCSSITQSTSSSHCDTRNGHRPFHSRRYCDGKDESHNNVASVEKPKYPRKRFRKTTKSGGPSQTWYLYIHYPSAVAAGFKPALAFPTPPSLLVGCHSERSEESRPR